MEENQELSYFNYGNNQIEQQATLNALANNVQSYVNNQAWSTKRKQKFLDAYSDIISKGIIGANNSTGQWALDLNQEIDLSGMSPKDQEMYHEAAYYILEQMKGIPVKDSEEKKEESKDLPLYDNDTHFKAFEGYIGNQMFGGRNWNIGGDNDDWNSLDERDSKTGIRGTTNRALKLADMLEGYSNSLEDGKYNFEGTAFKDLADLKGRIANAVTQLKNGTWDQNDKDALNQIGLDWRRYFNDGSGDTAAVDANGNPISYAQLAAANQAQVEEAAKTEAAQKAAAAKENAGVLSIKSGFNPREARTRAKEYAEWLGRTHGVGQQGFNTINQRVQELIEGAYNNNLDAAGKKELGNLLEYIKTNNPNYQNYNLTPEEEVELQIHGSMKGRRLQDFRRLPWQTSDGRNTYVDNKGNLYFLKPRNQKQLQQKPFTRSAAYNNYKNNFLFNTKAGNDSAQSAYLNQEGAENAELYGIVADIASIIDPEPFSAMGLSLSAAGARNYAKVQQPGKWNWKDYGSQGLDYLTSVIGAIPIAGDAALAAKVIKNLRRLGRFGAWSDIVQSTDGLADIWNNKIMGDQKMTKQDWRIVGTALRGLVSHGRLNQSNLAARTVMRQRGLETGNAWHQRYGFTSSVPKETSTPTLKVTKNGKSEEIDITPKQKQDLQEAFKKAKPSERTAKAKEILGNDKIPEGAEVRVSSGVRSTVRNWNRFTRRTSDSFGTKPSQTTRTTTKSDEEFEDFLKGRSTWNKIGLGSNRYLRRIDRQLNLNSNSVPTQETSQPQTKPNNITTKEYVPDDLDDTTKALLNNVKGSQRKMSRATSIPTPKNSTVNGKLIDGSTYQIQYGGPKSGEMTIIYKGKPFKVKGNLHSQKKRIGQWIERQNKNISTGRLKSSDPKWKAYVESIKDLKRKGYLFKQGGQINNFNLDKIISEFLNKQK